MPCTTPATLLLLARTAFWIHVTNIPTEYANAQLVVDVQNDITLGAFNKNRQKVKNGYSSTVEATKVHHGVATWSCKLRHTAKLQIVVWGDGFEKTFRGFTVENGTSVNCDVVMSLTNDSVSLQPHVHHPILPVFPSSIPSQATSINSLGIPHKPAQALNSCSPFPLPSTQTPSSHYLSTYSSDPTSSQSSSYPPPRFNIPNYELDTTFDPSGPLVQALLKYIVKFHVDQALGQPTPPLSFGIQRDEVNLQDPRTLVEVAQRIADELDDRNLGKILEHIN
eukprot:Phypoly_transcript_10141.p1 GENE.Phypoly_transcript_10141~~Phypoly_transcript_10141.p1  ORF type:complete len:280 (+),score=43.84 Phypoly_transcript_10141:177-1016(+)